MRRMLVVVDMQNDFCEGGALAVAGGNAVAQAIQLWIDQTRTAYHTIVASLDWHIDPGTHWSVEPDYVDSWPVHCKVGTDGAEFNPLLKHNFDEVFIKGMYSAAYSAFEGSMPYSDNTTDLGTYANVNHITHVDIVGLALDYCVLATALDSAEKGYVTRVLLDKTAAVHSSAHDINQVVKALEQAGVECV